MAVQNALVQISLERAPSTAVMTTNVTRFMMDVGEVLLRRDPDEVAKARRRANHTFPAIVGFAVGCGLGAACEATVAPWALALPTGACPARVAREFWGRARRWAARVSRADLWAPGSPQTGRPTARRGRRAR